MWALTNWISSLWFHKMPRGSGSTDPAWSYFPNTYVNHKLADLLFRFIVIIVAWRPDKTCVKPDIWTQCRNKGRQKETRTETSMARYLFDQPKGTAGQKWGGWMSRTAEKRSGGRRKWRRKRKKLMEVEKGERSGASSVVPMVQRMSCLCSRGWMCVCVGICVCVSLESPRALRPKGSNRDTYYPPETWHTTRERDRRRGRGISFVSFSVTMTVRLCVCVLVKLRLYCIESVSVRMNSLCAYLCGRRWNVADHCVVPGVCLGHTSEALTHILQSLWGNSVRAWGGLRMRSETGREWLLHSFHFFLGSTHTFLSSSFIRFNSNSF